MHGRGQVLVTRCNETPPRAGEAPGKGQSLGAASLRGRQLLRTLRDLQRLLCGA